MKDNSETSRSSIVSNTSLEPVNSRTHNLARLASIDINISESDRSLLNFGSSTSGSVDRRPSERTIDTVDSEYSVDDKRTRFADEEIVSSNNNGSRPVPIRGANEEYTVALSRGSNDVSSTKSISVPPAPISSPQASVNGDKDEENRSEDGDEETLALIHDSSLIHSARTPSASSLSVENERLYSADTVNYELEEEDVVPPLQIERSRVSFGSARNIRTNSIQMTRSGLVGSTPAVATAIAAASDTESEMDDSRHGPQGEMMAAARVQDSMKFSYKPKPGNNKKKGVLKNSHKAGPVNNKPKKLSFNSRMYDLDGDGVLDEVEQAMRDRDVDGDGQLDTAEVYKIVQDQLRSEADVHLYKKVAAGLLCLVAILALSNFGTSMASAILAKDTRADSESGTIQSKKSGEVMGVQGVTYQWELTALEPDEFEERRLRVEAEMMEDPDHEDHHHRKLGRRQANHCSCSKVAYDHGKMREEDLRKIMRQCDGANQVSIKRKWRNDIMEGYENVETEMICGPGYEVKRSGRKKKNRKKTKTRVVEERVQFVKKGRRKDGRDDKVLSFDCEDGYCFGSGSRLQQGQGHSCDPFKEYSGASECDDGLYCLDGTCTALSRYSRRDQVCDVDFGLDACVSGYACVEERVMTGPRGNGKQVNSRTKVKVGVVRTGYCRDIVQRGRDMEVCDVGAFGNKACDTGYICLGANGRELERSGIGYCTRLVQRQSRNGICDLSYGRDACDVGYYCRDTMLPRTARNGAGGAGLGAGAWGAQSASIVGPSGAIHTGQTSSAAVGVRATPRSTGTGMCTRSVPTGGVCSDDFECESGRRGACVGLGANSASGGTLAGPSGVITWGNGGGAATGYCA